MSLFNVGFCFIEMDVDTRFSNIPEKKVNRLDKRHGRFTKATQNQIWFIKKVWFFLLYSSPILLPIDSLFFLLHTQLYAYTTMTFQKNKTFNNNFSTNTKHIEYEKKLQATKKKPMHSKQKLQNLKPKGQTRQMSINKKKS